jgi:hypothetical protein
MQYPYQREVRQKTNEKRGNNRTRNNPSCIVREGEWLARTDTNASEGERKFTKRIRASADLCWISRGWKVADACGWMNDLSSVHVCVSAPCFRLL